MEAERKRNEGGGRIELGFNIQTETQSRRNAWHRKVSKVRVEHRVEKKLGCMRKFESGERVKHET